MPFCHARLQALKPMSPEYPKELKTIGDHIRKRRLDLGLFQRQAAEQIGVSEATICNWERSETGPGVRHIPWIIKFLDYDLLSTLKNLPGKLKLSRQIPGLPQRAMAEFYAEWIVKNKK